MSTLSSCLYLFPESLVFPHKVLHLLLEALIFAYRCIFLFAAELKIFLDFMQTLSKLPDGVDVLVLKIQSRQLQCPHLSVLLELHSPNFRHLFLLQSPDFGLTQLEFFLQFGSLLFGQLLALLLALECLDS